MNFMWYNEGACRFNSRNTLEHSCGKSVQYITTIHLFCLNPCLHWFIQENKLASFLLLPPFILCNLTRSGMRRYVVKLKYFQKKRDEMK